MNRIIFLDIDGTIIDVPRGLAEPSEKTKYAINELINNGDLVFIASGRYKGNVPSCIKSLKLSGLILSNGAIVEYNGKEIHSDEFDKKKFIKLRDYCVENNCLFVGEAKDHMYTPKIDDILKRFLNKWKLDFVNIFDKMGNDTFYKACVYFENKEKAKDFENEFKGILDYRAQTADPESLAYDVNDIGVNKGSAVDAVLEILGFDKENTYCFCDGTNDIELVKACKNSFVMENGDERLKKIAYGLAKDVLEDGFYYKLVELGLIEEENDKNN